MSLLVGILMVKCWSRDHKMWWYGSLSDRWRIWLFVVVAVVSDGMDGDDHGSKNRLLCTLCSTPWRKENAQHWYWQYCCHVDIHGFSIDDRWHPMFLWASHSWGRIAYIGALVLDVQQPMIHFLQYPIAVLQYPIAVCCKIQQGQNVVGTCVSKQLTPKSLHRNWSCSVLSCLTNFSGNSR